MAAAGRIFETSLPYLVMIVSQFFLALFISLLQFVITEGANPTILVVYEQIIAAVFLTLLSLFIDRGKRPAMSFNILAWAFFIGFLQIPFGELLLTASLRYMTATFQTVALNTIPAVVFALAVFTGQETFGFRSLNGLLKILGIVSSTVGAVLLVLFSDSGSSDSDSDSGPITARWLGIVLVGLAVLTNAVSSLLVEKVALRYGADLSLSATMCGFGAIQTIAIAAATERDPSSWEIKLTHSLQPYIILYGGLVTTGLGYFCRNWCVRKKGPVFAAAFSPLLIVFSFILQTLIFGSPVQIWSVLAALLIICSLYILLWAKYREHAKQISEPLLV